MPAEMVDVGDARAAGLTHAEARHLSKLAVNGAIHARLDLVIDGVGNDDRGQFSAVIGVLRHAGYDITVRYATAPITVAKQRESARAEESGRHVPTEIMLEGHRESTRGFLNIVAIAGIEIEVWDTSGDAAIMIARRATDGPSDAVEIHDDERYHLFLEKAVQ